MVCALALASFGLTMLGALGETLWRHCLGDADSGGIHDDRRRPARWPGHRFLGTSPCCWSQALRGTGCCQCCGKRCFPINRCSKAWRDCFGELGLYLKLKSSLFEPVRNLDVEARRLELAQQNGRVVAALNTAKEIILHRVGNSRPGSKLSRYLKLYFLAQDIHERASSSHYPYNALADAFFHSDVMFRCQRLLRQQGIACQRLSTSIKLRQPFIYDDSFAEALTDLHASLEHLRVQSNPAWRGLLRSLRALAANLGTLDRLLSDASNPDTLADATDSSLLDRSPRTLKDVLVAAASTPDAHVTDLPSRPAPAAGAVHRLCDGALDPPGLKATGSS